MNNPLPRVAVVMTGVLAAFAAWTALAQSGVQTVQGAVNEQKGANTAAVASQERVNKLDDETQDMLNEYRTTLRETDSLRRYNDQLELQIKSQQDEMVSIQNQIQDIERTNREIYPLMQKMIETLDRFVALDLPFLKAERAKRIANLKDMMARADVSTAEKYRRILEAYAIEMEYGRTIEDYQEKLGEGDKARTVNFLRIGRVALMYQTLDGGETGYWDADKKDFVESNHYKNYVKEGLKIARKQVAPDLLIAPVRAPEAAEPEKKS
jgi:TolA-binding protein